MTVSSSYAPNVSTGNGVTTVFPYNFRVLAVADLEVSVGGVVKTYPTDYSVSGVGSGSGGNVTFAIAPANGAQVIRRRNMSLARTTDYQDNGDLLADVLNPDQDAAVLMAQQIQEQVDRTLKGVLGETVPMTLPAAADRASKGLGFDANGSPVVFAADAVGLNAAIVQAQATVQAAVTAAVVQAQAAALAASNAAVAQLALWQTGGLAATMASMYANGETGMAVHGFSTTNCFSDTAGTTPATVNGLVAAVSKTAGTLSLVTQATSGNRPTLRGTPKGPNLLAADGNFATPGNWTAGAGWAISNGIATATASSASLTLNTLAATAGKLYLVRYWVTRSAGTVTPTLGGVAGSATSITFGLVEEYITASTTGGLSFGGAAFSGSISQVMLWDADSASVAAPYFLWFGNDDSLTGAWAPTGYPLTLIAYSRSQLGSTDASPISAWQQDGFQKRLLGAGSAQDRSGGSTITFSGVAGNTNFDLVNIGQFEAASLVDRTELLTGTPVANTNAIGTLNTLLIGKGLSASSFFFGRIYGFVAINRILSVTEQNVIEQGWSADGACQCWGDSLTAGSGATISYPTRVQNLIARQSYNNGIPSDTSAQILTRFNADTTEKDKLVNVIWAGTNDDWVGGGSAPTLANIASMVSGLKGRARFLVLSLTYLTTTGLTAPALTYLTNLNSQLAVLYGNQFVDIRTVLRANGDGGGTDTADIAAGNIPTSLRSDSIHLNDKGYQLVAKTVADRMAALGWARIG